MIMKAKLTIALMALTVMSCSKDAADSDYGIDYHYGRKLSHEKIVLGSRLENPYKTENITKALQTLYPLKSDRVEVTTTDLYVRFLPKCKEEYELLESLGIVMTDHPLDYEIIEEGDWYHDPEVPQGNVTWQYAVVPRGFDFPDVEYEIIDECYLAENDPATRTDVGIDWEAVERQAYLMTGNEDMLLPQTRASKVAPSGRITIVDEHFNDGKPIGVAGVQVSCNTFIKFCHCYTDKDGYYKMSRKYSSKPRYRLIFTNKKGFSIGFNLLLVPASVSTLGKAGPEGVNMTVTKNSESKLYKRCVVNNAAYDYYSRCDVSDLNISKPPKNLRIWIFHKLKASSALMMHHGALIDIDLVTSFLGEFAPLVKLFLPDITLGLASDKDYKSIYATTCHELAHASHFAKVGTGYWNKYIFYIVGSYVSSGGVMYGDGSGKDSGYCEIGEMWAYYMESKLYHERYAGNYPSFGTSYWFYPQILRYLEETGITCRELYDAVGNNVTSTGILEQNLISQHRDKIAAIELIFDRYR